MLKVIVTSRPLRRRSILNLWMPVTVEEMKKFIGVIFNALDVIGEKHLAILRFLLFDDNDETYNNRLGKVKYLVDITMKEDPEDHLSLDESLMLLTGSLIIRQCIKNLRHMGEP